MKYDPNPLAFEFPGGPKVGKEGIKREISETQS